MTLQLIFNSPIVTRWVAKRVELDDENDFGPANSIGVAIGGRPVAGVVYSWFQKKPNGNDIRVTIAAESGSMWARREVLERMFSYPFEQLQCARMTALIREGNARSEKLCRHLGFRKEGVMRRGWDGKTNALVYGILKSECKYLNRSTDANG